jgi:glycosyltransferase involved in cell wall biosynthesis
MMTADAVGGVWTFAAKLSRELVGEGFEILLVTLGPRPSAAQRAMISGCSGVSMIETDLALEWQDPVGADMDRARSVLAEIALGFEPQVVHLNSFREATFEWGAPTIVVAHSCVNSWAEACGEKHAFDGPEWDIYTTNVQAGLRRTTLWVSPTFEFRDRLRRLYSLDSAGHVIRNGQAVSVDRSHAKQPLILGAGRVWDKAKNLTALASIASMVDWPIKIAGAPGAEGGAAAGASNNCEFLGQLSQPVMRSELEKAAIFVSPALYEPFGLSVLEAADAGCALVLSDITTLRELWDGAACFVDPGDGEAMVQCLRQLISDDGRRCRLQRAAIERAGRYRLRSTVKAYRSIYDELVASRLGGFAMPERAEWVA